MTISGASLLLQRYLPWWLQLQYVLWHFQLSHTRPNALCHGWCSAAHFVAVFHDGSLIPSGKCNNILLFLDLRRWSIFVHCATHSGRVLHGKWVLDYDQYIFHKIYIIRSQLFLLFLFYSLPLQPTKWSPCRVSAKTVVWPIRTTTRPASVPRSSTARNVRTLYATMAAVARPVSVNAHLDSLDNSAKSVSASICFSGF